MFEQFFSSSVLARLINSALALDPQAQQKLSVLDGKRVNICLDFQSQPWTIDICAGKLQFSEDHDSPCDIRLSGSLAGFLQLFKSSAATPVGNRAKLYIEGDLYAAQQFQQVMGELKPDFEAVLRKRFGNHLGAMLAESARVLQQQGENVKQTLEDKMLHFLRDKGGATCHENALLTERLQLLLQRIEQIEQSVQTKTESR